MTETEQPRPTYTGMKVHSDRAGFAIWVPSDWYQFDLKDGHKGVLYSPYPDDINTGLLAEKHRLKVNVTEKDLPVLREGFMAGIQALPGVEIEEGSFSEFLTHSISFFEIRFTFLDGDIRRKRWIRNIYWGKSNYVVIAQGRTPEEFQYWLPMFFNIMMTIHI